MRDKRKQSKTHMLTYWFVRAGNSKRGLMNLGWPFPTFEDPQVSTFFLAATSVNYSRVQNPPSVPLMDDSSDMLSRQLQPRYRKRKNEWTYQSLPKLCKSEFQTHVIDECQESEHADNQSIEKERTREKNQQKNKEYTNDILRHIDRFWEWLTWVCVQIGYPQQHPTVDNFLSWNVNHSH